MEARYETLGEVEERLAANGEPVPTEMEAAKWWERAVPLWLFLAVIALGVFGVLFSIGLTLHEAYDAQTAMGAHISAPPFNSLFETIHGWLAVTVKPDAWLWG